MRNKEIVENESKVIDLILKFQKHFSQTIQLSNVKKREYANSMNDLLFEMKHIEKEMKKDNWLKEYKINTYENMFIQTKRFKQMKEEKKEKKRR